jgi:signal transduction histidine kinase
VAAVDFFVIAAVWDTIGHMWLPHHTARCYSDPTPFLPTQFPVCGYGGGARLVGVLAVLLAVALLLWSNWLVAGWALRPLRATADTVRRLGPQNLGQRIQLRTGADALKDLADALDDALDRLAAGYESQRRFAANASHELRTPLAVQRVLTEVAMEDPGADQELRRLGVQLLRTNERNERLIEGLLVLAESDRGLLGRIPVRLDELAESVLDAHETLAAEHGVTLHRKLSERTVPGDPVLLERLIVNLMANAIAYNEPGGWVEAEVAAGNEPALAVRNTGQHIPADVTSLFEPFRRLGADRTSNSGGVGLGLSIVRSIVAAHEGSIRARPRPEGGLIIEIEFPQLRARHNGHILAHGRRCPTPRCPRHPVGRWRGAR